MTGTVMPRPIATAPCYESLLAMTRRGGPTVADLLALSSAHDPFYAGQPSGRRDGGWFAELWNDYGRPGIHLRALHYVFVSQPTPLRFPDGTPYLNTEACWSKLQRASTFARYLKLVRADEIGDQRNPAARLHVADQSWTPEPEWLVPEPMWSLPFVTPFSLGGQLAFPEPIVEGYEFQRADEQPYLLEVWIEKSTMNAVLLPACADLGANLVSGIGYLSITRVVDMLTRVAAAGKPARIFYISDHDPSGEGMPIQVARQAEFWLPEYAPGADIKLTPIALDAHQVAGYNLPRVPIKESNNGRAGFEARHGSGAVELDALEALYPGELVRLLYEAAEPYLDRSMLSRSQQAERAAVAVVTRTWEAATTTERAELAIISAGTEAISRRFEPELRELAQRMKAEIEPFRHRLEELRHAVARRADELEIELPARPEPETDPPDESEWLFASHREYFEQLSHYRTRRAGVAR